jgi:flagellar capping protein FliD
MLPQLGTFYILDRHVDSSLKKLISKIRDARKNKDSKEHLYITKFRHY